MRNLWLIAATAAWLSAGAALAQSQLPQGAQLVPMPPPPAQVPVITPGQPSQSQPLPGQSRVTAPSTTRAPEGRILGVPYRVDAPVAPSYENNALKTLAGQPESGQGAIAAQGMQPADTTGIPKPP